GQHRAGPVGGHDARPLRVAELAQRRETDGLRRLVREAQRATAVERLVVAAKPGARDGAHDDGVAFRPAPGRTRDPLFVRRGVPPEPEPAAHPADGAQPCNCNPGSRAPRGAAVRTLHATKSSTKEATRDRPARGIYALQRPADGPARVRPDTAWSRASLR